MNHQLPSVFIGSSTEGLDIAREVELQLQRDAETTIWKDDVFKPGSGVLETLMNLVEQFDFAVMVLSPDDLLESRGQSVPSPRDNVVFELGLFMGRLGRSRVFVLHEQNAVLKLPSDLAGITLLTYRERENRSAALSIPSTHIIKAIRANGFSESRTHKNIQRLEGRQDATESRLRTLQVVVKGLVTEFEYEKLRGIASQDQFLVHFHNSMMQELNRLDAIRYIRPKAGFGIESVRERDGSGAEFDLK
ncbi:MAG TPA: nucleotide-binding protein, partial [Silvibacterium sp.]|nr:nucleotide-binding protein [Silvibacterium sp.]